MTEENISEGVRKVSQKLNGLYEEAVIITVVPGGILFTADLVRQLKFDIYMDYISCPHTPGDRQNNSEIVFHQNIDLSNKDVILVDDAVESGGTMKRLVQHIAMNYDAKSISVATLFVKPSRVAIGAREYYGFEMDNDELLMGYGLPWKDKMRNLPYISKVKSN
ncbi:hypoxanthine phosphoribosyltransferase [Alteromonas lipolytica]|uniref:Hypoxanthine phosphoribosyltransferase n=1 Tax=Alteromonas lipolytica TaxID=1856405 RepID=A0A1E8FIF6_9ALTE|nr:hypoxanthine phosphoribosyltransferase [Alteromonas lipolytica]